MMRSDVEHVLRSLSSYVATEISDYDCIWAMANHVATCLFINMRYKPKPIARNLTQNFHFYNM